MFEMAAEAPGGQIRPRRMNPKIFFGKKGTRDDANWERSGGPRTAARRPRSVLRLVPFAGICGPNLAKLCNFGPRQIVVARFILFMLLLSGRLPGGSMEYLSLENVRGQIRNFKFQVLAPRRRRIRWTHTCKKFGDGHIVWGGR